MLEYKIRGTKVVSPYPVQLTPGECRLIFTLQRSFAPENILADCYFPKPNKHPEDAKIINVANLVQVDCIAVSTAGIFVFESKDYGGWIYGHGGRQQWTQVLDFGREKCQFYNPIKQNQAHLDAIRAVTPPETPLYSIIAFGRDAVLKVIDGTPSNCAVCTLTSLRSALAKFNAASISPAQATNIVQTLQASRINPTALVRTQHIDEASYAQKRH